MNRSCRIASVRLVVLCEFPDRDRTAVIAHKGTKWQHVRDRTKQLYLLNAYRVLLTRARQGLVIFVPRGDEVDSTRPPAFYDGTYNYLRECGLPELGGTEAPTTGDSGASLRMP